MYIGCLSKKDCTRLGIFARRPPPPRRVCASSRRSRACLPRRAFIVMSRCFAVAADFFARGDKAARSRRSLLSRCAELAERRGLRSFYDSRAAAGGLLSYYTNAPLSSLSSVTFGTIFLRLFAAGLRNFVSGSFEIIKVVRFFQSIVWRL